MILVNDPRLVPGLRAGATVEVPEASLFDYLHSLPDRREEGNETGRILQAREGAARGSDAAPTSHRPPASRKTRTWRART